MPENIQTEGLNRRSVVKAAAWAAPVVAVAVAAPMAAASAGQANIAATAGGDILADDVAGTANGNLVGGLVLGNVVGTWETGELYAEVVATGPWNSCVLTKADGSPFTANETILVGGTLWTVVSVEADAVVFTAPSVSVSANTSYMVPEVKFSGTFTSGAPTKRNPVGATIRVSAENVNSGRTTSNSVAFP